ncbi:pre-mRNA splicing factor [Grosmannia clavigera kw1407]|uniref:Pre-mRNA splicing factor n=1 Tax=Grosmannia clavigera (strain kw1407 / UAMH 11150) TaxID=655863 RepID=F0XMX4_GROCL|nr:pre-mRNA splicing factor [Grosmannia clavigera kw1407]EFX00969.1 pre-mRNA splicing factor [Grosmannia clavigera kw1407]
MSSNYNRDVSQYKYSAMSNLVLQADRRFVSRRKDEPSGDPESMAGRLKIQDMGSRIARDSAPKTKKTSAMPDVKRGDFREGEDVLLREQRKRQGQTALHGTSILGGADLLVDGLRYRPRTSATRSTFELILSLVAKNLGDVPHEVVRSAADAVLEYLKDPRFDKKREVDDILGVSLNAKEFNELMNLGKKITDYDNQEDEDQEMADGAGANDDEEIDDRQGVAVDFEEDDDEDAIVNEVRDESSEDEEDEEDRPEIAEEAAAGEAGADRDEEELGFADDGDAILIDPSASASAGAGADSKSKRQGGGGSGKVDNAVAARDIDAYWLQRQIGRLYPDAHTQHDKTQEALRILAGEPDEAGGAEKELHEIENEMMELFDYEHPEVAQKLIDNREKIVWLTKLARAESDEERGVIEREMASEGLQWILNELQGKTGGADASKRGKMEIKMDVDSGAAAVLAGDTAKAEEGKEVKEGGGLVGGLQPRKTINLENLVFEQGNHLMTNPRVSLPEGSTKRVFKGYEEIHVPPPKKRSDSKESNIPVTEMPEWARGPFSTTKTLNRIQSRCYPSAFEGDGNLLVCAPTGSGKTNVSMLTILREIGKNRDPETGEIDLDAFKIVYIAPLKALVQEQVGNFSKRLEPFGVSVRELTGDRQLTKQQIAETQVIVTTPEKWDVITRKATDLSYTRLVRLIIIDEIHLLHDDRGPVLESIVSRTLRRTEQTGEAVRLVGLSATLPNYRDVGSFLRVDATKDLFHFDGSYRPCPLRQEFIGVTERKPIKQLKAMNDITYAKVLEHVGQHRNQMLIFVHSRKDTAKTARHIRDRAVELETISQILKHDAGSTEVLREAAEQATDRELKDLLPYGFGIHHAGMSRADRTDVEDLFAQGAIQVLCCTATLAWGVNLPAHTVIIKGTQVYSPEKGSWVELSPQDVLQMLGRAGRPQFDTYGEGIIITAHTELPYYLSLLNQQLPIESQLVSRLADSLNAEVVLGNVRSRDEAVEWLGYTYLFVRMLRAPGLYQVGAEYEADEALEQKRVDLAHAAAVVLRRAGLVRYDEKTGRLQATELGRIASHYYVTHGSMETYNSLVQPGVTAIELMRIFALSAEFRYIPVRQEEKLELARLLGQVPIPVKESVEEAHAKVNVLLQAYISRLRLDGLALMADMVYVTQSAGRILRAIFEIALKKGWAGVARTALELCKMAEKRMWPTMTPLRQFASCPRDVVSKAERIDVPWPNYFDLDPPRMGELLGLPRAGAGAAVCRLVSKFPRLQLQAQVLPVTRSLMRISLTITPRFVWDEEVHGLAEAFWIVVEDGDGEEILFHDQFLLRREYVGTAEGGEGAGEGENEHVVELTVPIADPLPPNYFVSVVSDRWMHAETRLALPFHKLILPDRFPPHTELLDLQPLPVSLSALKSAEHVALYQPWTHFNRIQTQTFSSLFSTDQNVLVGAATGSGKTVCAEFALLRLWSGGNGSGRAVYVAPLQELVDVRFEHWERRFGDIGGGKTVAKLTGDVTMDLKLLAQTDLVLATPAQWDALARDWPRRKTVQTVQLFIADDLHMIGSSAASGHVYEVLVSRMAHMRQQLAAKQATTAAARLRIVALCVSMANAREMGDWIGAAKHDTYNFSPQVRPVPLELHLQSYTVPHFPSLMLAMAKPAFLAITQLSAAQPALVFVPSRKQTRATARDLLLACVAAASEGGADGDEDRFLHVDPAQLGPLLERVQEPALREALSHGVAYYHEALSATDKRIARHLFANGAVQVMVASRDVCWELARDDCTAHLVVVMGTQQYDGREHRYVDYALAELLQMFGRALRPAKEGAGAGRSRGVLMLPAVKRDYYKKFLNEALPVESLLHDNLADAFMAEVSVRAIRSGDDALEWLTRTFFYRRLLANPSYYSLGSRSEDAVGQFLTALVEDTLLELRETKLVEIDDDDDDEDAETEGAIRPQNGASVATYYGLSYVTMQTLLLSLTARTRLKGMLEIVTAAAEFETLLQTRRHEERLLQRIYDRVPVKLAAAPTTADEWAAPAFKAFVLLQAHFARMQLPVDLARDQEVVVARVPALLSATADLLASQGHLNALQAMEMTQMVVQAMWDRDSPLKQIPHFTPEVIKDVFDFIDKMNPEENKQYADLVRDLGLTQAQLVEAAHFTNDKYPDITLDFEVEDADELRAGEPMTLKIKLEREGGDESDEEDEAEAETDDDLSVHAPFFPGRRLERWWLVVGEERTKSLLAIKRTFVGRRKPVELRLPVELPEPGEHTFKLYLMSDSYVGVDQDPSFTVQKEANAATMTDVAADAKATAPAAAAEEPKLADALVEASAPAADAETTAKTDGEAAAADADADAKPTDETRADGAAEATGEAFAATESDAPAAEKKDAADETASTPAKAAKASTSASRRKSVGQKLNRKASKIRTTHLEAKPGDHYFVKLKGYPAWPVIICDEDMLPQTLVKSRPVSAARQDGTYREDYADGGKRAADRTFPVMYLFTNEFGWVPNQDMHDLDPSKVLEAVNDKMRKDLQHAHKLAAESNPLGYYKDMLRQYQEDLERAEEAKRQAQATPKKTKKVAYKEGDVDMLDVPMDDDEEAAAASKKAKKRKADDDTRTPQRSDSAKKPKIKITSSGTPKSTNGTPTAAKSAKSKPKNSEVPAAPITVPVEDEVAPEEKLRRKTKEIYFLRHKIQNSLLPRDQAPIKPDEMKLTSDYLTKLESFSSLEVVIIRQTKINKLLKAILKIETIPREEEFKFKPRSHALLDKWSKLLAAQPDPEAAAARGNTNGASTNGHAKTKEAKANGAKDEKEAKDGKDGKDSKDSKAPSPEDVAEAKEDKAKTSEVDMESEPPKEIEKAKEEPEAVEATA